MEILKLILELVRTILAPQVVIAIIAILFYRKFYLEIKNLIDRIAFFKFPGGEISTSQLSKAKTEKEDSNKLPNVPSSENTSVPEGLSTNPDHVKQIRELFEAERAKAYLWEYRYLNYFLANGTQRILDWLASLQMNTTISFYDSFWQPVIPDAKERQAIINALQQHHLISLNGELIEVSPKGREYIQWRGPLPSTAA